MKSGTIGKTVVCFILVVCLFLNPVKASAQDGGYDVFSDLWLKSVLRTSIGNFTLIWKEVGRDITPSGDNVISGYFYADPDQFAYGSEYNPELFVKIYVASNGWANIAFNHVTVDNVDVYSAHRYSGTAQQRGSVTLQNRLAEHSYTGVSADANFTPPPSGADASPCQDGGYILFSELWAKSVLRTAAGSFTLKWKEVGSDTTPSGDKVISGYFYANPDQFAYGSKYNPELFVKVYVAANGWANIAFNHVTVDPIDVYSARSYKGSPHKTGNVTLQKRLAEHSYIPDDRGFAPFSDVGATYEFTYDYGDKTYTAKITDSIKMEGSIEGSTYKWPGRHSYVKTGDNTAKALFQWGSYWWAEMDLTFTSNSGGTFIITTSEKNNTGKFTFKIQT